MIIRSLILPALLFLSGCASLPSLSLPFTTGTENDGRILTGTSVSLSQNNFTIVKPNVVGESWGVSLLGLFPVTSPQYTEAISSIYEQSGLEEGQSRTLVNIVHEKTSNFYLLFSIPRIYIRADIVEFKANKAD